MVNAIVRACADAHAQTGADLGKVRDKDKGDGVPSVRKEDIVRSVVVLFFFFPPLSSSHLFFSCRIIFDWQSFSLAEAQKMTSMYAKMEYGVKRLLWLGG